MAAVAPQQAMQTIQLQVPPDAQPGFMIQANINGQTIKAQVPPGLEPGATFSVQVPAAPVDDPAANAAYDALLAGASRLTFSSKHKNMANGPYDTGPWSVEADTGATFQVTFDGPSKTSGHGDGSYNAQVLMDDVLVQTLKSPGVATGNGSDAYFRCPHPPASQSMDRGEALTIQLERPTECGKYQKCICCGWPEEYVRLTRGGGGGLSLVSPPSDKKCGKACCGHGPMNPGGLWLMNPLCTMAVCPPICLLCLMCSPIELGRDYHVAYDATGAPLGGAQFVVPGHGCCCKPGDPWLDLGATPVAARRDLVAAAVAMRCTDSAAYVQPGY